MRVSALRVPSLALGSASAETNRVMAWSVVFGSPATRLASSTSLLIPHPTQPRDAGHGKPAA